VYASPPTSAEGYCSLSQDSGFEFKMAMYNPNRNGGYGISGAKNIYTSKVRIGNWVEDQFGGHLASRPRPDKTVYKSCSHAEFEKYDVTNSSQDGSRLLSATELKSKNKDGLNYAILFAHGPPSGHDIAAEVISFYTVKLTNGNHSNFLRIETCRRDLAELARQRIQL
jgi:hypothetical protein